ncbi:hypothetical protein ACEWY4_009370 [Coilia grayii]|uniref:Uncharacterized protein n=1 Tax=Coilia grayii TaxID=363190 RepID=A0ABD1K6I6_9TELE
MEKRACLSTFMPGPSGYCIICQKTKKDIIYKGTAQGLQSLKASAEERQTFQDEANIDAIHRILTRRTGDEGEVYWHKGCFATFTDKGKIQRLNKSSRSTTTTPQTNPTLRSRLSSTDWKRCLFCQDGEKSKKETLCSVMTFKVSQQIIDGAKCDHTLSVRVAGISDLIAAEAKYHPNCYKKFLRRVSQSRGEAKDEKGRILMWLTNDLRKSAANGHILELKEVFSHYCSLAGEVGVEIPPSFLSRISTFKEYIEPHITDIYEFIKPRNEEITGRQTVLLPTGFAHVPVSELLIKRTDSEPDEYPIPVYRPEVEDDFLAMVHVALQLRSDILALPPHKGLNVSKEDAIAYIPEKLYMFVRLLIGGQTLLEKESDESEGVEMDDDISSEDEENDGNCSADEADDDRAAEELKKLAGHQKKHEQHVETRVMSVAQDLVYIVSGGKNWTPKHIGLAASLHQATRSKQLVKMFHNAGHIISYRDILRIDTALATHTLSTMDKETGAIIPANLVQGRFIHFSADNIDINEGTLDGQNTFHATQYAAWQRGPISVDPLENVSPTQQVTLKVPEEMNIILPLYIREGIVEPDLNEKVCEQWFQETLSDCPPAIKAVAKDRAFHMKRQAQNPKPGWTRCNEEHSYTNPEISLVGYMPIIPAPAHDINTMNTVVRRIMQVAKSFNQSYAVLTVDQALFPLLMELKWIVPEYKDSLIPRLGGLHISLNFLKVLGKHMQDSGLAEIWKESGLFGPGTVHHVLDGKDYNKGVRAHKITVQALWQLLLPEFQVYLEEHNGNLKQSLETYTKSDVKEDFEKMCDMLSSDTYNALQSAFISLKKEANPNFQFWWQYTEMVQILLLFIRSQREGNWGLHLYAFQEMLPYFHRYDHTNYARWGPVYLAQMKQLPAEVQDEFDSGNWVVKGSSRRFNQVDPDQAQEWMNGVGKKSGGIIGITKTPSALFRWTLSYSLRTHIAAQTREMYHLGIYDEMAHNESNASRRLQDHADEKNIMELLQKSAVFSDSQQGPFSDMLQNIVTKDIATAEIQDSLLNAFSLGQEKLITFVKQRLMQPKNDDQHKKQGSFAKK